MVNAVSPRADEYDDRLRGLVTAIRDAVSEVIFRPIPASAASVAELLASAPSNLCLELVDVWREAQSAGLPAKKLRARLTGEERQVLDLVLAMYDSSLHEPLPIMGKPR